MQRAVRLSMYVARFLLSSVYVISRYIVQYVGRYIHCSALLRNYITIIVLQYISNHVSIQCFF